MILCKFCGMRADVDKAFHRARYGHFPVTGNSRRAIAYAKASTRDFIALHAEKDEYRREA